MIGKTIKTLFRQENKMSKKIHLYRVNVTVEILAEGIDEKDLLSKLEKHIDAFTDAHSLERFDVKAIDKEGGVLPETSPPESGTLTE